MLSLYQRAGEYALEIKEDGGAPCILEVDRPEEPSVGLTVFNRDGDRSTAKLFDVFLGKVKNSLETIDVEDDPDLQELKRLMEFKEGRMYLAVTLTETVDEIEDGSFDMSAFLDNLRPNDVMKRPSWGSSL